MVWVQHGLFSYSVAERHLECVHVLVVIHGAARNFVYRFLLFEIPGKFCCEEVVKNLDTHSHKQTHTHIKLMNDELGILPE